MLNYTDSHNYNFLRSRGLPAGAKTIDGFLQRTAFGIHLLAQVNDPSNTRSGTFPLFSICRYLLVFSLFQHFRAKDLNTIGFGLHNDLGRQAWFLRCNRHFDESVAQTGILPDIDAGGSSRDLVVPDLLPP